VWSNPEDVVGEDIITHSSREKISSDYFDFEINDLVALLAVSFALFVLSRIYKNPDSERKDEEFRFQQREPIRREPSSSPSPALIFEEETESEESDCSEGDFNLSDTPSIEYKIQMKGRGWVLGGETVGASIPACERRRCPRLTYGRGNLKGVIFPSSLLHPRIPFASISFSHFESSADKVAMFSLAGFALAETDQFRGETDVVNEGNGKTKVSTTNSIPLLNQNYSDLSSTHFPIIFRWSWCNSLAILSSLFPRFLNPSLISLLIPFISLRRFCVFSINCLDFVRWDIAVASEAMETGARTNSLFGLAFTLIFFGINGYFFHPDIKELRDQDESGGINA
jgi:hypothetical protein